VSDIQTSLPIHINNSGNTQTAGVTASNALQVDLSQTGANATAITVAASGTFPVSGTITNVPSGTQPVSGTVTNVPSGTQTVTGTVTAIGTITNVPSGTQPVSGTITANAGTGNFSVAYGTGTFVVKDLSDGPVSPGAAAANSMLVGIVYNTTPPSPTNGQQLALQSDSAGNLKVAGTLTTSPSGTQAVSGTITAVQSGTYAVSGTVTNVPSGTQPVSGTVTNVPSGTQTITGTVTQASGSTVTVVPSGTQPVSGTVTTVSGEATTGIVTFYATSAAVANASVGTLSYTVTAGKTLYLKQAIASSSGGPCKVVVDYGAGPTVIFVGFYSTTSPILIIPFPQPVPITATTVVNVKITNNAGVSQDLYGMLQGQQN
jgi:hypothetical protein